MRIGRDELFERMSAWEDAAYIMAAGTCAGSDTNDHEGIVDGHAYTILDCQLNVAGSEFDLIRVRNPWGTGEFQSGMWDDDGKHPTERCKQCSHSFQVKGGCGILL